AAERQLAAEVAAKNTPDWRMLRDHGLQAPVADAEYLSKTLPQIAGTDIASAQKDVLLAELQKAGDEAAAAYGHLRRFVADTFFDTPQGTDAAALKADYRADRFAL